jgi:hypothetical protein
MPYKKGTTAEKQVVRPAEFQYNMKWLRHWNSKN